MKAEASVIGLFYVGAETAEDELARHASARLARYKCPRLYVRVDTLPRGANNKLSRRTLKTDWEAAHGPA